jgi:hypothetical protein
VLTISDDVDHTKNQSVLGPHCDVTSVSVPWNRSLLRRGRQEFMHLTDTSNLITRGVDGKDEDKDDREEHGSVGAVLQKGQNTFAATQEKARPY